MIPTIGKMIQISRRKRGTSFVQMEVNRGKSSSVFNKQPYIVTVCPSSVNPQASGTPFKTPQFHHRSMSQVDHLRTRSGIIATVLCTVVLVSTG